MTTGEWWTYGSAFVVLVGVVGETIADLTTWVKSDRRKAILAKASALVLILGLTGDVVSIRLTQIATASLNAEAARANERAGKAEERAGKAEEKAARLESQIADRHITLEQRKKMMEILASGRGTPIAIGYLTDSGADAPGYSLELAEVFCEVRWVVSRPLELISNDPPVHGLLLDVQSERSSNSSPHATSQMLTPTPVVRQNSGRLQNQ